MGNECNLIHQLTNLRRQCTGHARTRRPAHAHRQKTHGTQNTRCHVHAKHKHKSHACAPRGERARAARKRQDWPWDWLAIAPQNLRSTGRGESGRAKGMHGQRSGTPARRRCRRGSSRRTHTGGLKTPCSRSDRLKGTPDRGGRSQAGPGDRLGGRVWEQVGARGFWASGGTWASAPPQPPVSMVSVRPVLRKALRRQFSAASLLRFA
jgi:hypothetical protein